MKRYFFFDIDGTLTTPLTADYPDSAREAVRRLQEKGNHAVIVAEILVFRQVHVTISPGKGGKPYGG